MLYRPNRTICCPVDCAEFKIGDTMTKEMISSNISRRHDARPRKSIPRALAFKIFIGCAVLCILSFYMGIIVGIHSAQGQQQTECAPQNQDQNKGRAQRKKVPRNSLF